MHIRLLPKSVIYVSLPLWGRGTACGGWGVRDTSLTLASLRREGDRLRWKELRHKRWRCSTVKTSKPLCTRSPSPSFLGSSLRREPFGIFEPRRKERRRMHICSPFYTLLIRRSAPRCSVIATFPHKGRPNQAVNRCASIDGYVSSVVLPPLNFQLSIFNFQLYYTTHQIKFQ